MNIPRDIRRQIVHMVFSDPITCLSSLRDERLWNVDVSGEVEVAVDRRLYWAVRNQVGMHRMMTDLGDTQRSIGEMM